MPHHHHSHVAQRTYRAKGEFWASLLSFPFPLPLFVLCPAMEVIGDVDHGLMITTVLEVHTAIMPITNVS
jgi:hypothetical protein